MGSKQFGARYGLKPRAKFELIEKQQRAKHKCPHCSKKTVKRVSVGIWKCSSCRVKYGGKAYSPA